MTAYVNFNDFCDGFSGSYKDNFSYDGKRALFDYMEELEEELETPIDFDPIAICCEYTEYADLEEIKANYEDIKTLEDLQDQTQVIEFEGGIIIADF